MNSKNHKKQLLILDCGMGNIGSLVNAVSYLGFTTQIIKNYKEFSIKSTYDGCILPGVGTFDSGMNSMRKKYLDKVLYELVANKTKILGICLGMQMLVNKSEESNSNCEGLGLIDGEVKLLNKSDYFVPHIGWAKTNLSSSTNKEMKTQYDYLSGDFYYVHSYHVDVYNKCDNLGFFKHGNTSQTAAILRNNIMGVQFHPEKSQQNGLKLLNNYFEL